MLSRVLGSLLVIVITIWIPRIKLGVGFWRLPVVMVLETLLMTRCWLIWVLKVVNTLGITVELEKLIFNSPWSRAWQLLFSKAKIYHLIGIVSDHRPLLLVTCPLSASYPKPFHFKDMWTRDSSSSDVVGQARCPSSNSDPSIPTLLLYS